MNAINYKSNGKEILEDEVTKGKEVRAYGDEPNPKKQKTGKPKPVVYTVYLEHNADGLMGTIEHLEGSENWTETTMPCLAVDDLDVDRDTETTPDLLAADGMYGDDEGGEE